MSRADRLAMELRCPDKTNAAQYVGTAMRGRLDDLLHASYCAAGGAQRCPTGRRARSPLDGRAGDERRKRDAAIERLV